jgi:protein-S-isoprenylcysteine O-methyltransferase Ste14
VLALFPRFQFYSKVMAVVSVHDLMPQALGPILKTILFTIVAPGFVTVGAPYLLLGGFPAPGRSPLAWLGLLCILIGASIYFSCAGEFAVRGLGTPAPIAPTKFLVVSGLHRYVRNPMYIGVWLVVLGESALFHAPLLVAYAAFLCLPVYLFVIFYEEPTLHRQFGTSYDEYRRAVPRWIPRFRK